MKGHRDLEIVSATSVLCALLALILPFEPLRLAAAVPLTLFLPGYALTAMSFAGRQLGWAQFLALSLALSLTALALGALVLNYLPGGIRGITWALLLVLVVIGACRSAALRRPRRRRRVVETVWPKPRLRRVDAGLLLGGLAAAVAAIALAGTPLPADNARGYTELWMLPLDSGREPGVRVGVRSQEQQTTSYTLRVRIHELEYVVRRISLAPGETRTVAVRANPPPPGPTRAAATLYRDERPGTIYRRVTGWTRSPEPAR